MTDGAGKMAEGCPSLIPGVEIGHTKNTEQDEREIL